MKPAEIQIDKTYEDARGSRRRVVSMTDEHDGPGSVIVQFERVTPLGLIEGLDSAYLPIFAANSVRIAD